MDNARELVLMYEIFMFFDVGRSRAIMEKAKELMLMLKQNKSHVGYGRQKECEALVSFILGNMAKSQLPPLKPEIKNKEESISYRECGNYALINCLKTNLLLNQFLSVPSTIIIIVHTRQSTLCHWRRYTGN